MNSYKGMLSTVFILAGCSLSWSQPPARPFPQHVGYYQGTILPNHISRKEMDDSVRSFYWSWKKRYLRKGCAEGQYFVKFNGPGRRRECVSEGQGYGMMITVLMAGADPMARQIFDGLFRYYRAHPSKYNPWLMSWAQGRNCRDEDRSSATDGDMDIAYSLLLADAQWGVGGSIRYRDEAHRMISAVLEQEINPVTFSVLLSNTVEHDSKDFFDMRSSDFMPAHCRAFLKITSDPRWDSVMERNYRLFELLQKRYSAAAGLFPDFIIHIHSTPVPARSRYLESRHDGSYNYNACRVPWRIATDYLLHGDHRALAIVERINRWIRQTTGNNPNHISAGYELKGNNMKRRHYDALSFIAPFAVSSMVQTKNQAWLNLLWNHLIGFPASEFDYYDNSIKMIDLVILSGNYWAP